MMDLERLVAALGAVEVVNRAPVEVRDLAYDARSVTPGAVFFCVRGERADGHDFAPEAVEHGAVALVVERPLGLPVPQVVVPDARAAIATLAAGGRRPGLLGTVEARVGGERRGVKRTTPEAIDLQRLFREMLDAGDRSVAMAASSHASALHRLDLVRFSAGNPLGAVAAARLPRTDAAASTRGLQSGRGVAGRFETVDEGQPCEV